MVILPDVRSYINGYFIKIENYMKTEIVRLSKMIKM